MGHLPTGPQRPQTFQAPDRAGFIPLQGDRDGWPQMPPPKGAAQERPSLAQAKGYSRLSQGTARKQEFTGHPTGNVPHLAKFSQGEAIHSPMAEPLMEGSIEGIQNRMTVYHGLGGIRDSNPAGDYIAPNGHRSRTLPEHLAYMKTHVSAVPFLDARSGAAFSDAGALRAYQVATRFQRARGSLGPPVRSTL